MQYNISVFSIKRKTRETFWRDREFFHRVCIYKNCENLLFEILYLLLANMIFRTYIAILILYEKYL